MILNTDKVAGVAVLYHPTVEIIVNIRSYINQVDILYLINNTPDDLDQNIVASLNSDKIVLVNNYKNKGIATALNQAAMLAQKDGYEYLLTMDQDSKVSDNLVERALIILNNDTEVGIVFPSVINKVRSQISKSNFLDKFSIAMTSGSIIRLDTYNKVGGFLDKLFIDYVDYEFSLRMILNGYKIIQMEDIFVYHNLGNIKEIKILSIRVYPTNHLPIRWYYRTRNRFYIYNKYKKSIPDFIKQDKFIFAKELIKILLFEKKKISKYYMILKGYLDYKNNKYWEYSTNSDFR
jgi:rhamnosyltransferase